eukprot:15366354-Ditylum_brightwellii.AAC.1
MTKAGTETVHNQHIWLLLQLGHIDLKPQEHWDNDFLAFLASILLEDEIFIGLDANAGRDHNKTWTTHKHTHPMYNRGKPTLDHI